MPINNAEVLTIARVKEQYLTTSLDTHCLIINANQTPKAIDKAYKAGFIMLTMCVEGEAIYRIDSNEYKLKPYDILILKEEQVVTSFQPNPEYQSCSIYMSQQFFDDIIKDMQEFSFLFRLSTEQAHFTLQPFESKAIMAYCQLIESKMQQTEHHYLKETISTLIKTMIYDISEAFHRVQKPLSARRTRSEAIFEDFILLVEANFKEQRRVSWYSQQLCITPKYLAESVKKVSRRTPNEWIIRYVTWELRAQLKGTRKNIKEIAENLHFPNQSLLGKFFKEQTGMSPSEYRRN